jgi:LacI family transcriptional regulator
MEKFAMRKVITLKDIAQATGYSINTVSRVLRGKDDISEETMKTIKKTADKLGYINNTAASSLRLGRTNTIAVILGDISNPHFSIMTKEIENHARQNGYSSFLLNTNEDLLTERQAIQLALSKNVDGIIICPSQQDDSNIRYLIRTGLPFVQIGRRFIAIDAAYAICNDELGGYQAVKYLLEMGHRDILMLNGPSYISSAIERQAGYLRAMKEAKVQIRPELIRIVPITGCSDVLKAIFAEKIRFSAIFAFSDMLAWEAWTFLQQRGYKVPDDYSIIGFDYIQSRFAIPFQLSTISSYKAKISITAVECLLCLIRGDHKTRTECEEKCRQIIDTTLVKGETVRNLHKNSG